MADIRECLAQERCIFLSAAKKKEAIGELVAALCRSVPELRSRKIRDEVLIREEQLSTRINPLLAIPHAQFEDMDRTYIVVGRSPAGVVWEATDKAEAVPLVILIVGDKHRHLEHLSAMAVLLEKKEVMEALLAAVDAAGLYNALVAPERKEQPPARGPSVTRELFKAALQVAGVLKASSLLVHLSPEDLPRDLQPASRKPRLVFVVDDVAPPAAEERYTVLPVPFKGRDTTGAMEIALLLALAQGLIKKHDTVISLYGRTNPATLDSLAVTEMSRDFDHFLSIPVFGRDGDIKIQVFMTLLEITRELSREGREGKPVGVLFVLGDHRHVSRYCQQMVANPFKGYDESERNILDPSMAETLKEFSRIDGAIVIRGDGVIVSAGTYLRPDRPAAPLPSGLGARHAAAAAITAVSNAVSLALSESTRKISLFHGGERIMVL